MYRPNHASRPEPPGPGSHIARTSEPVSTATGAAAMYRSTRGEPRSR